VDAEERFSAKVVMTETCHLWSGATNNDGYGKFRFGGKFWGVHRLAYTWCLGPIPAGYFIDHTCHNRNCVRVSHLRVVTRKQNNENRSGAHANSKSGVRGVYWIAGKNKWRVVVHHNKKNYYGGHYDSLVDAEKAAIAKRNELFTHNERDRSSTTTIFSSRL